MWSVHSFFIFLSQFVRHCVFGETFRWMILIQLLAVLGSSLLIPITAKAAFFIIMISIVVPFDMALFFLGSNTAKELIILGNQNKILKEPGSHAERIRKKIETLEKINEQYLKNERIPERLCCPISHDLMFFPVKGEDGHYYDQLYLAQYYYSQIEKGQSAYYLMDNSLKINWPFLEIDMKKYMEIQSYIRSVRYRKSTSREMAQDAVVEGIKVAGVAFLVTGPFISFSHSLVIFSSALGFLGGIGLYFRARYAIKALESVREEMEAAKNASASREPIEEPPLFKLGKSSSHEFLACFKSWVPSFDSQNNPYTHSKEWYAGFQAGVEEDEITNLILYEYEFPKP